MIFRKPYESQETESHRQWNHIRLSTTYHNGKIYQIFSRHPTTLAAQNQYTFTYRDRAGAEQVNTPDKKYSSNGTLTMLIK